MTMEILLFHDGKEWSVWAVRDARKWPRETGFCIAQSSTEKEAISMAVREIEASLEILGLAGTSCGTE
jgi:hypothetical protein